MKYMPINKVLQSFPSNRRCGDGWSARCPAHNDSEPSLSIAEAQDGRVLLHCHAGCDIQDIVAKVGLHMRDLFPMDASGEGFKTGEGGGIPPHSFATLQPTISDAGCTLAQYADLKRLPIESLRGFGLRDISYDGQQAVRIPYFDEHGNEGPVRFRVKLSKTNNGDGRFKWRKGSKPVPYGLWRLDAARRAGYVVRVEGESDCHTGWHYDIPVLGIPGASAWHEEWATYFDDIPIIYDVIEPDKGGEAWLRKLSACSLRDRVHLVRFEAFKDLNELHRSDPGAFLQEWRSALENAVPWSQFEKAQAEAEAEQSWQKCESLARGQRILDRFVQALNDCGVAGESRTAKIIYLAMVSRFLNRPVSIAIKGPSSGGKSYITEQVLGFFPETCYYALSAMSERALAYSEEPLSHRFLVVFEAAGLRGEFATYLIRSLLSEGRVRYETVEKTPQGMRPRLIEREGPTGLIVTTTSVNLHPENETRMFSLTVSDTPEQTRMVLLIIADETERKPDLEPWHALQNWLQKAEHRVTIPYARALAERIPPVATRLRRDFTAILSLIRAHAILHQAQRERNRDGQIVVTLEDYEEVMELVADLLAEGLDVTISPVLRETVKAVQDLTKNNAETSYAAVARQLGLDKATALRRVRVAINKGYVRNLEDRKGREARLVCGELLPEDIPVLPLPLELCRFTVAQDCKTDATFKSQQNQQDSSSGCMVAPENQRYIPPSPGSLLSCVGCGSYRFVESDQCAEPLCANCAADRAVFVHNATL